MVATRYLALCATLTSAKASLTWVIPLSRERGGCFIHFPRHAQLPHTANGSISSTVPLKAAADLGTAYEWLAKERDGEEGRPVSSIRWVDISGQWESSSREIYDDSSTALVGGASLEKEIRVPLYPLPAAYLPSGATQTLNNVEPQNMKMAQDLDKGMWDGLFCVVLRAADTGRVASIGTLMRAVNVEEHRAHYDSSLLRVTVRCRSEGLVHLNAIENPGAWSAERRLRRSDEYLIARVQTSEGNADEKAIQSGVKERCGIVTDLANSIFKDYGVVRSMYVEKEGIATRELPPFAVDAVQNIPELNFDDFADEVAFWDAAEAWQVLCNTIREARRCDIQSTVNEIMICAATEKGGPLELPVHREDLPVKVQTQIKRLEDDAARDFVALGMDPCLDFQALISCPSHLGRLKCLHHMVSRERSRLETKEKLKGVFAEEAECRSSKKEGTGFE